MFRERDVEWAKNKKKRQNFAHMDQPHTDTCSLFAFSIVQQVDSDPDTVSQRALRELN